MEAFCDLHLHSTGSDGSLGPAEVAREAYRCGVKAAILTDHNTLRGVQEFLETAQELALEAAAGVEISCDYREREVHILGLFLPPDQESAIETWLGSWEEKKKAGHRELARRLQQAGFSVSYEELCERYAGSRLNRVHFAGELCRIGACHSVQEAFDTYLRPGNGYYVPAPRPEAGETIRQIGRWGGLPVLAHPPLQIAWEQMEEYLSWAKAQGAVGAEVYYSGYSAEDQERMQRLCQSIGLLESGGSDFHGAGKPDIRIGSGRGDLCVPYRCFEQLQKQLHLQGERNQCHGLV